MSSSVMPRRSAARLRWHRASCTGWKRWRARSAGRRRRPPANNMFTLPMNWIGPTEVEPIAQPAPKPPRATRPLRLSVTAIEDWLRDPYTIYAKYILKLDAARSRRHAAVGRRPRLGDPRRARRIYPEAFAATLPDDPAQALRAHRREIFRAADGAARGAGAVVAALPAHRRMVCGWEIARRDNVSAIDAEIRGEIPIRLDNERTFVLSARADRIERRHDGTLRDPRLQDRTAADRQAGAHGAVAAAHAGGGDPARGRF